MAKVTTAKTLGVVAPASVSAGVAFNVTVTAKDSLGNTVTNYTGPVHFSTPDTMGPALPIDYTFVAGDHGVHVFTNGVALVTITNQTVTVTDALDKIHTTADSHHRVMVMEVMGRDAGWIALEAGIAGGAHIILIPEIPFTMHQLFSAIRERESQGKRFTIVVVAEGVNLPSDLKESAGGGSVGN